MKLFWVGKEHSQWLNAKAEFCMSGLVLTLHYSQLWISKSERNISLLHFPPLLFPCYLLYSVHKSYSLQKPPTNRQPISLCSYSERNRRKMRSYPSHNLFSLQILISQVLKWWICLLQAGIFYWVLGIYLWALTGKMLWIMDIWWCTDYSYQLHMLLDWGGFIKSVENES